MGHYLGDNMQEIIKQMLAVLASMLAALASLQASIPEQTPQEDMIFGNATDESILNADTTLNTEAQTVFNDISARQDIYFAANGLYFQELASVSDIPLYPASIEQNNLFSKPHYQKENWADLGLPKKSSLPFQVKVNQYQAPNGYGWQAIFTLKKGGLVYEKSQGAGVETIYRNHNWEKYEHSVGN